CVVPKHGISFRACAQEVAARECVCATPPISLNALYSTRCVARSDDGRKSPSTILPSSPTTTRSSGCIVSYGTPLGLITTSPSSRAIPLALPNVYSTNPRRTSSRFASNTASRSFANLMYPPAPNLPQVCTCTLLHQP